MGLSKDILEIIEQNKSEIITDIPFRDILPKFHIANILSTDEYTRLLSHENDQNMGILFMEILKSRNDNDFCEFCNILKNTEIRNVKGLGRSLEVLAHEKIQARG